MVAVEVARYILEGPLFLKPETVMRPSRWPTPLALLILPLCVGAGALSAQQAQNNHLYDKFQLDLSGTVVVLGSNFRVDGSQGAGTDVDGESVLGLPSTKIQPRASLRWRPGRRHELEIGYQFARRSGDKTLADSVVFDDSTYQAGANIHTVFNTDQAFLTYRYAFLAHERTQIGFGIGLGAFFFKLGIDALVDGSGGGQSDSVSISRKVSFVGPIGSLGLYGRFLSGEHWLFEADIRGIAIKVDRIRAAVGEASGAVRYYASRNVGIELGYGISAVKVELGPRANASPDAPGIQSGKIKFNLQNIRLGVVFTL
jgi:hypothetical protein